MVCEVIRPEIGDKSDKIECQICELSYTLGEYGILSKHQKLGYFYNEELGFFCHQCLFEIARNLASKSEENKYDVLVKENDKEYFLTFHKKNA